MVLKPVVQKEKTGRNTSFLYCLNEPVCTQLKADTDLGDEGNVTVTLL